jgi:hypothetical protein
MKKIMVLGILSLFLIFTLHSCFAEENTSFEVHEWGVFMKDYDSNSTSVQTISPPMKVQVMKPVIYFHSSHDLTDVLIKVSSIQNAMTIPYRGLLPGFLQSDEYPSASIENNTILWNIDVKNNSIEQNDTLYPYLFYEGDITSYSPVKASIVNNGDNIKYYVKNIGDYKISNVFLILGVTYSDFLWGYNWNQAHPEGMLDCVYFGDLSPGEEKTILNTSKEFLYNEIQMENMINNAIIADGLTSDEADELIDYWSSWWFYPEDDGIYSRLIYSIPQSVYDELLPLTITPQPDITKRVGIFTITDIPTSGKSLYNPYSPWDFIIDFDNNISWSIVVPDYSNISVTLFTDKTSYDVNENISITLTVTNSGEENITSYFSNPLLGDFEILNESGEQVYSFSYNKTYIDLTTSLTILPGEIIEVLNTTWNQTDNNQILLPAGNYTLRGWLPTSFINIYSNNVSINITRKTMEQNKEGTSTPGFEIIILICALMLLSFWKRKRKN